MANWNRESDVIWKLTGARTSVTAGTATQVASYTMPGGTMGANGAIEITCLVKNAAGGTTATITVSFGGTNVIQFALGASDSSYCRRIVSNLNSESSQFAPALAYDGWGTGGGSTSTSIDTSAAVDILFFITADGANPVFLADAYVKLVK